MKHLIVGTAGHVDHGKTALIRYLTGTDTDRLQEEKKRGISIDIGFAVLSFEDGLTLGIVDVPGHEKFLKNMLAGTGGIDMVLLVIAADEGIMPQTREHFEMLQCFGIKHGIVVLNKVDKVDKEWVLLIEEDVRRYLKGTFLENAPICQVSAMTGAGMTELRSTLKKSAITVIERDTNAPFRLWIDRAFNMKGQGLIVTGSVLTGKLKTADSVLIFPGALEAKVREIETYNQSVNEVGAGQRASVKLGGVSLSEVGRGMFLSEGNHGYTGKLWDVTMMWKMHFPSGTRIRLHIGTGEFIGRMSFTKKDAELSIARLHLEVPLSAGFGDQGILRRYSPQDLIGGVTLLGLAESNHKYDNQLADLSEAFQHKQQDQIMLGLLRMHKEPPILQEWVRLAGFVNNSSVKKAVDRLVETGKVKQVGTHYVLSEKLEALQFLMQKVIGDFHRQNPDKPGIPRETLRQKIDLPGNIAEWFMQESISSGQIISREEYVAAPFHARMHGQNIEQMKAALDKKIEKCELVDITPQWLAEKMQRSSQEIKPFFEALIRDGSLVKTSGVHVYRKTMQYIETVIQDHFVNHPTLSVGELRDLLNTSRRLAIPVMEYFDTHKYTIRREDIRLPGPNLKNLSE